MAVGPAHIGFAVSDKSSSPCNFLMGHGPWPTSEDNLREFERIWNFHEFSGDRLTASNFIAASS